MKATDPDEFFIKVHPILSEFELQNEIPNQLQTKFQTKLMSTQMRHPSSKNSRLPKLPKNLDVIRYFLKCLSILGQTPFCYDRTTDKYRFSWSSADTLLSLTVALAALFAWFIFISHLVFQKFFIFGPW